MDLNASLAKDKSTRVLAIEHLELLQNLVERFQEKFPSTYDCLCSMASNRDELTLPHALDAFVEAIELLKAGATTPELKNIELPPDWTKPKFKLGQLTKQGLIIGMQYNPDQPERTDYKQWVYCTSDGTELSALIDEVQIEPLSPEELVAKFKGAISYHTSQLAVLKEQLKQCLKYNL